MDNRQGRKPRRHLILWFLGFLVLGGIIADVSSNSNTPAPVPTATTSQLPVQSQPSDQNELSNDNTYTNSDGDVVHSPAYSNTIPEGATAQCRDGTYSFSEHRRGTCSHHGGVEQWLH